MVRTGLCPRSCASCRSVAACRRKSKHPSGRKRTMLKTNAAAAVAIALAWATPALAQNPPPQARIHERLEVSFKDAAGQFLGRLFLSDVTTSHSAVEGYLQGSDGYIPLRTHAARQVERVADHSHCQERGRGHRPRHSPAVVSRSEFQAVARQAPVPALPVRRSAQGGDTAHAEVRRRRAARQRFAGGTPRQHRMRGHGQRRRASRGRHTQLDEGDTHGRVDHASAVSGVNALPSRYEPSPPFDRLRYLARAMRPEGDTDTLGLQPATKPSTISPR